MTDAETLYFQGLRQHRDKRYAQAAELLERAVALQADYADAWEALGVLYDKLDRVDDAIRATERWIALKPDDVMAHTNLSRFYMKKGLKDKAEEEQGKARLLSWRADLAGKGPQSDASLQQSGAAAEAAPQIVSLAAGPTPSPAAPAAPDVDVLAQRIAQFEALVRKDPGDLMSRFSLGRQYLLAGRAAEAIPVLEELLRRKEDYTAAMPLLGEAYEKAGKLARAIKLYQRGIEVADRTGDLMPRNQMQARLAQLLGAQS